MFAYALTRSGLPFKGRLRSIAMIPILVPSLYGFRRAHPHDPTKANLMKSQMRPVLLVSDTAQRIAAVIAPQFPDIEFVPVSAPEAVGPALETYQPEVILSLKHSGFDGPAHRPLIDYPSVKWVQVAGSGYDHFVPWDATRVTLTNSVGVLSRYLAETATGAMMALNSGFLRLLGAATRPRVARVAFQAVVRANNSHRRPWRYRRTVRE